MARARRYRRRSREEIDSLLERFDSSGLSQAAFARHHDLSLSTLHSWLHRRRYAEHVVAKPRFVPVVAAHVATSVECALELDLGNDRRLHIPADIDREVLATLLPVIVTSC